MGKKLSEREFEAKFKQFEKSCGADYSQTGLAKYEYEGIPTGHDDLDDILTKDAHGFYIGGIIELMGSEGSGKTSLAMRAVGNAQKMGLHCCWIDAESGFSPDLAILNGVDLAKLKIPKLVLPGKTEESDYKILSSSEVLEMAFQHVRSNLFSLVVIDSVAGLTPDRILADDFDPNSPGVAGVSRSLSSILPKIAIACDYTSTSLILVNQIRVNIGSYIQDPYHTPGGKAMRHLAQQRIAVEKIRGQKGRVTHIGEDGNEELIGHYAKVVIIKNKKAPPMPEGIRLEIPIYYREYFPDLTKRCYDIARKLKVITIRNGILKWKHGDEVLWENEGESEILAKIRDDGLESRLALCCVEAAKSDKNQNLKNPVRVSQSIVKVAAEYKPGAAPVAKKKKSTKKVPVSTASLDDET